MSAPSQEAVDAVLTVAGRFARRVWWAEREELNQVAMLAMLESRERFDAEVGVPFSAYAARAAAFALKRFLWAMSAPVSGGQHRPEKSLAGLHRTPIAADGPEDPRTGGPEGAGPVKGTWLVDPGPDPETALHVARRSRAVRERVEALAAVVGASEGAAVAALDGRPGGERSRSDPDPRGTASVLRLASIDAVLYDLAREREVG